MRNTAELVLIRHTQTGFSRPDRFQEPIAGGDIKVPLSPLGRLNALNLVPRLSGIRPVQVFASDLIRAVEVVEPLASSFGLTVVTDADLRERRFGRQVEGDRPADQIRFLREKVLEPFWSKPYDLRGREQPFPDMETDAQLMRRVYRGLN